MKLTPCRCLLRKQALLQSAVRRSTVIIHGANQLQHFHGPSKQTTLVSGTLPSLNLIRHGFLDARDKDHHDKEKTLIVRQGQNYFDIAEQRAKNKETFQRAVHKYLDHQGVQRRGHVEFIYASMTRMKAYGVEKDLETYKQIMDLFPKDKMVATSTWQRELMHYPKQQQCCIDLLDHMEEHGVCPDDDVGYKILAIFGKNTYPFRKYQRMMYWMPKFKYANPYPIPQELPDDRILLAKMALERMAADLENKVTTFQAEDEANSIDHTFIVSAQSPIQRQLIEAHPADKPLYVEGGFTVWLRHVSLTYFVLRSDQTEKYQEFQEQKDQPEDDANLFKWNMFSEEKPKHLVVPPSVHEQDDGTILATCITGTGSKDSLASWIKALQPENPRLASIPVVFLLRTPESGIQVVQEDKQNGEVAMGTGSESR